MSTLVLGIDAAWTAAQLTMTLPRLDEVPALSVLKRLEDQLDALVCCWVGLLAAKGQAVPLGGAEDAIWVPNRDDSEDGQRRSLPAPER